MKGMAYCLSAQDGINFLCHLSQIQLFFQDSCSKKTPTREGHKLALPYQNVDPSKATHSNLQRKPSFASPRNRGEGLTLSFSSCVLSALHPHMSGEERSVSHSPSTGTRGLVPLLRPERAGPTPSAPEGLRGGGGGSKANQGVPGPAS